MRVRNRLFPYPVINKNEDLNCFKGTTYELNLDILEEENSLILDNLYIKLNNQEIINLINQGILRAVIIVESSKSIYREMFEVSLNKRRIEIPLSDLRDTVEISSYIYATEDFEFTNNDFQDVYQNSTFKIEKYSIIAIDDGFNVKTEHDCVEDKKLKSIFSIIKSMDKDLNHMKIDLRGDKTIKIVLPEKEFEAYNKLRNFEEIQDIFFAIMIVPALVKAFEYFKAQENDIDDIVINYSWFETIKSAYKKKYDSDLTIDILMDMDSEKLAQDLVGYPSTNSFIKIQDMVFRSDFDEE